MDTRLDEIADGIYRVSSLLPVPAVRAGLPGGAGEAPQAVTVNQFLVLADEPLLFHTGFRAGFPALAEALRPVLALRDLRWVAFGHIEADECGALDRVLEAAPHARVAFGEVAWPGSLDDLLSVMPQRPVRRLEAGDKVDLGGRLLVHVPTPHAPHGVDAQVLYEETTGTLLSGDLFGQAGAGPAVTSRDLVDAAVESEAAYPAAAPGPAVPRALRSLAALRPRTIATMHGSAFEGDGGSALLGLADAWEDRFGACAQVAGDEGVASRHG
jgi:flavorubredoxin